MKSWDERKSVVKALVSSIEIKQRKMQTNKISSMFEYCLRKQMFCSTLGMASITDWLTCNTAKVDAADSAKEITKYPNEKHWITKEMSEEAVTFVKVWLLNAPCVETHYCRKVPAYKEKRFLEPGTKVINLFERYQHDANEASKRAVGFTYFKKSFADLKMSIFMPRKDVIHA
ncbi:hypothetical protein LOTGIDRAFT_161069 [Lottia gigantea]|uniref:Uncharacterized protein n=1 Tax=Lottia gigantea TaxID=225164 RepID=V3ZTM8_LOTGI|nr:hypothetical protein LOTGIDRAFT_161069 [Lottia gigantea]ESO94818.1 hypothetical protein LOTGIDRAFT_161069 [Lottia gigantea]